eukprot:3239699-Prorocentrum_lima.AAC.1
MQAVGHAPTVVKPIPADIPMKAYPGGTGGGTGVAGASPLISPTSIPTARGPITSIPEEQEVVDDADTGGTDV